MSQLDDRSGEVAPVTEPPKGAQPAEHTTRALHLRIHQQEILAGLGVLALQETPFLELLNETARLTAEGMESEFCKVLEYLPSENRFLVRAGVGWHEGIVGVATVGADLASPSGLALRTGKPVISNHLENEQRFRRGVQRARYRVPARSGKHPRHGDRTATTRASAQDSPGPPASLAQGNHTSGEEQSADR